MIIGQINTNEPTKIGSFWIKNKFSKNGPHFMNNEIINKSKIIFLT